MKIKLRIKYGLEINDAEFTLIDSNGSIECSQLEILGDIKDRRTTINYFNSNKKQLIRMYNDRFYYNGERI